MDCDSLVTGGGHEEDIDADARTDGTDQTVFSIGAWD